MSKIIYIFTLLYTAYVIDEVEGDNIVGYLKETIQIDLSKLHRQYRSIRDNALKVISFSNRTASPG